MKANRAARHDEAGPEIIGALILFAIFATTIAVLNVTAVPNAGLANEEDHYDTTLAALNGLQAEAESAGESGATVGRAILLAPERSVGQDFFSFFMASPARSSGELIFEPEYGNITVTHQRQGPATTFYDIGSATERLPLGRITFDQHPNFRDAGLIHLENGGVITGAEGATAMRYSPPITMSVSGDTTYVSIMTRVFNGTGISLGGTAPVRLGLTTAAATLVSPPSNNARTLTLRMETEEGPAWGAYLNATSQATSLSLAAEEYYVGVDIGATTDVVTWIVNGTELTGNDIRLTTGIAVFDVAVS